MDDITVNICPLKVREKLKSSQIEMDRFEYLFLCKKHPIALNEFFWRNIHFDLIYKFMQEKEFEKKYIMENKFL